jgi:hypothetical protein
MLGALQAGSMCAMENTPSGRDIYLRDNATKTAEDPESFWKKQSALAQQRLSDPALFKVALAEMKKQSVRLPVYYQKPLEMLLEEAHEARSVFMSFNGRNGGKRKDTLQILIERIVEEQPKIDCNRLLHRLKAEKSFDAVVDVTDGIISCESAAGEITDVKIAVLKHRLSRAKKK